MNKELGKQIAQIESSLAEGQSLLELNDFNNLGEREEEIESGFGALKKVEAYIKELEKKIDRMEDTPSEEDVLANKGIDLNY
tara:strand:+ start:181 stop:426 length:246 start_codon:yes stop_codon:yes gene_type:complete